MDEIVRKGRIDQSQIKEKIIKLEKEINDLVYKLYDLTKDEIKIVEESLK